jgi:hypothetical protein
VSGAWEIRQVPLKYGIGDWTAARIRLRLHCRSVRLSEHLFPSADPQPPADPARGPASGYMLRALPVAGSLPQFSRTGDYLRYVLLQYGHCYIDLSIGMEAYRAKFSGRTRSTIMRKVRKFEEHCGGLLDWRTYRQPVEMAEFHRLARDVSARTYQERLLDAGIPDDPGFEEEMLRLASQDAVRGWILFDRDRPVSYLYCPAEQSVLVYAYLGYDPDYMKHSVGTILQWLAVEQLYAEGRFTIFDFTEGQSDHKRLFATHELQCANLMFVCNRPWLALAVRTHAAANRASSRLGSLTERWGIKSRLRRMMRFGLSAAR